MIKGKDTIGQAQSGTGKTATFSIGTLQVIDQDLPYLQAILLSPVREIAKQTHGVKLKKQLSFYYYLLNFLKFS